jgi:hypothetical protein
MCRARRGGGSCSPQSIAPQLIASPHDYAGWPRNPVGTVISSGHRAAGQNSLMATLIRIVRPATEAGTSRGSRARTHGERPAIRGEPQTRTFQCDTQLGPPLGSPPPEHHPYLVQHDATPKVGPPRVVAHCRWQGRTRLVTRSPCRPAYVPPHRFRGGAQDILHKCPHPSGSTVPWG